MWKSVSALLVWGLSTAAVSQELVLETWRVDDEALWKEQFLPRFQAIHPEITLKLHSQRSAEYDRELAERLAAGKAGDLITCRPYDQSLRLFQQGHLLDLTDLPGMENFPSFAKAAWQTDSGAQTFCLPIASVIQGFYFNVDIFKTLGLRTPRTRADFFAVLEKVKQDGRYLPLALAAHDSWVVSELGYQNIGPNYWHGEDGRLALINGQARVTDAPYMATFRELASWRPYIGDHPADTTEAQAVDAFASGKAAMIVAGSWSLAQFTGKVNFGAFPPPVAQEGDTCYFTDHTDMGIGINAASPNKEAALKLVEWMASADFAESFSNSVPGFFSLSNHFFELKEPVANTMMGWRDTCDSTLRLGVGAQFLTRGEPSFTTSLAEVSQSVVLGTMTPEAAAARIQQGLASWYLPQKTAKRARLCEADEHLPTLATSTAIGTESPFAAP
ncbi:ABC transporter substrate-binding protein [Aeromonas veronii]|uniref:ABC transporter substrate-binding protein n=1 Tax=Aeromonas veronii TaxID=654 RepID=UPI00191CA236|nr:extracellular solute-binding protein [Aeromonas veronii]MBL0493493.1 extracellular solute-binding protein [Aeromonas veronii]